MAKLKTREQKLEDALDRILKCIASTRGPIPCNPADPKFLSYVERIALDALAKPESRMHKFERKDNHV